MGSKQEYIRNLFDDIAGKYDITNNVMSLWMNRRWRREAARLAAVKPNSRIIDLCCGTGALSFKLAKLGQAEVVGVDYSERMIEEANDKLKWSGAQTIRFINKSLYGNGYPDGYFDASTIAWGLRNTEDCQKTVNEMARLVRPGGRIVMLEMGKIRFKPLNHIYWSLFGILIPLIGYFFTKNIGAYEYFFESSKNFLNQGEMMVLMQKAGLQNIRCKNFFMGAVTIIYGDR